VSYLRGSKRDKCILLGLHRWSQWDAAETDLRQGLSQIRQTEQQTKSIIFRRGYAGAHRVEAAEKTEKKS